MVEMESREVCCCGARTWTLVIGWLEAIGSTVYLLISVSPSSLSNFRNVPTRDIEGFEKEQRNIAIGFIVFFVIQLVMAILLITGVNQKKAGMVKAYLVWKVAFLVIFVILWIVWIYFKGFLVTLPLITGFLINFFLIWVVNVHRKEILPGDQGNAVSAS